MLKLNPSLWPHPTHGDQGLYKLESIIPEEASTQVTHFWLRYQKIFSI